MLIPIIYAGLILSSFFYRFPTCKTESKSLKEPDGFSISWTEYAPTHTQRTSRTAPGPTIFILPPTGGETALDRQFASALCARNQKVLIVKEWTGAFEDSVEYELHNRLFSRANRAVQILEDRYEGPLRIMGTSLGGLYSVSIIENNHRFERAVLIAAGFPFSRIIADSENSGQASLRERRFKKFKLGNQDEYRNKLDMVFEWNHAEKLADVAKNVKILMVVATEDKAVPSDLQENLANLVQPEEMIKIQNDHFTAIVKASLFHSQEIINFMSAD